MNESNEQKIAKAEIRQAVEKLIYACNHNNAAVAGFIWGAEPPIMVRFANIIEKGPEMAALLIRLNDIAEDLENAGQIIEDRIEPEGK